MNYRPATGNRELELLSGNNEKRLSDAPIAGLDPETRYQLD